MKTFKLLVLSILILSGLNSKLYAQLNDYGYKLGVKRSYASPDTYFLTDGLSFQVRPFVRFELSRYFDLGIGIAYSGESCSKFSDNDGLNDVEELYKYNTDPKNADSEGDKLFDGIQVDKHKTNPVIKNTHGGSVDDFVEVKLGRIH